MEYQTLTSTQQHIDETDDLSNSTQQTFDRENSFHKTLEPMQQALFTTDLTCEEFNQTSTSAIGFHLRKQELKLK